MKNKKGFTLVELMSVIVVLAIIIAIAVPAYNRIKLSIDKKNYENKVSLIEVAAAKYSEDTRYETMYVDDLIKNGYLDPDKENGDIFNDISKERINCYLVRTREEAGIYYAELIEKKYEDSNGQCSANIPNDYNQILKIKMINATTGQEITRENSYNWWTNSNVNLQAEIKTEKTVEKYEWYKGYSQTPISTGDSYGVKSDSVLQENYTLRATLSDGEILNTTVRVLIDKITPKFYDNDGSKLNEKWVTELDYGIKAYDNESGLYGYYFKKDGTECSFNKVDYKSSKKQVISDNGTYKVCVMDNVGNVGGRDNLIIDKIDNKSMNCNIVIESGTAGNNVNGVQWYKGDSISLKVTPVVIGPSGVSLGISDKNTETYTTAFVTDSASAFASKTLSSNINGTTYYGFVKNQANTKKSCNMKVYYEKSITPAIINNNTITSDYNSITIPFTKGSSISGIASEKCTLYDSNNNVKATVNATNGTCKFSGLANKDNSLSYYVKVTTTSNAGNSADSNTSNSITIPGYCTANNYTTTTTYTPTGNWTTCSNACGGGIQYRNAIKTDTYTSKYNNLSCGTNPTTVANYYNQGCGGKKIASYGDWSGCTKTCGIGTQSRTLYYVSTLDGITSCGTSSESQNCNTQDCCSSTTPVYSGWGTCSKTCGGGTQTRTVSYKSAYNGSACATGAPAVNSSTLTQACNTQACGGSCSGKSDKIYVDGSLAAQGLTAATCKVTKPIKSVKYTITVDARNALYNGSCGLYVAGSPIAKNSTTPYVSCGFEWEKDKKDANTKTMTCKGYDKGNDVGALSGRGAGDLTIRCTSGVTGDAGGDFTVEYNISYTYK